MRSLLFILFLQFSMLGSVAQGVVEVKSAIFTSLSIANRSDLIVNTHNTLLFGGAKLKVGPYFAYESKHSYIRDQTIGMALRMGGEYFGEIQAGYYMRNFDDHQSLQAKGYAINLVGGWHVSPNIGVSLVTSAKRIEEGMDPRWMLTVLPYLGVRFEL